MLFRDFFTWVIAAAIGAMPFVGMDDDRDLLPPLPDEVAFDYESLCDEAVAVDGRDRAEVVTELAWLFHEDQHFGDDWWQALLVVDAESGCRKEVRSRTNDFGLFQINRKTWGNLWGAQVCGIGRSFFGERYKSPEENTRAARCIYDRPLGKHGIHKWRPWVACRWSWCR